MLGKAKTTVTATTEPSGKISTIIGPGAVFDGNLSSTETIRIDGTVNGNCNCQQKMIVGPEGTVEGNITSQSLMVSGKIDGDVMVHGKLELLSTGNIHGNITTKALIVDEGGCFDGKCIMKDSMPVPSPEPPKKAADAHAKEKPADTSK